jgi:hypothetical protein
MISVDGANTYDGGGKLKRVVLVGHKKHAFP